MAATESSGDRQRDERALLAEIQKNPNNVAALYRLAGWYMQKNAILAAIPLLQRSVQLSPSSPVLNDLGVAYRKIGRPDLALPVLKRAIELDCTNGNALYNYAGVLTAQGELTQALDCFLRAGELEEELQSPAIAAAATVKEKLGRVEEALNDVLSLIQQGDKTPALLRSFGNILQQHKEFREYLDLGISLLRTALEEQTISSYEVNSYYFLLGNLCQSKKDFRSAFQAFQAGHSHSNRNFNEEVEIATIERIYLAWSTAVGAAISANSPAKQKIIFVVGMPRSGSTLVEQILSVSSDSVSIGESDYFGSALAELLQKSPADPALQGGRPLSAEEVQSLRSLYMQRAFHRRKPSSVMIDKTLNNIRYVGQILQVFPHAKIIWTRRDPRDTCLSCYTFDFAGSHPYRHDLRTLARYYQRVERLMAFWQERYPDRIYSARYEEMIKNPEAKIRALVDFCGLPWSEDYLKYHQLKRTVTTASYNQVTQPIYTSSVGRWKDYEEYLTPLLEELDLVVS